MTKLLILLVALASLAYVSAIFHSSSETTSLDDQSTTGGFESFAVTISRWIVETVSRKIIALSRFFNLKFRNLLEEAVKFGNFTLSFLPQSEDDPLYWWVPAVSEFISITVGDAGLFGTFQGPVKDDDASSEEAESEISEVVTNPPIFFNAQLSSTERTTTDSNEIGRSKGLDIEGRTEDQEDKEQMLEVKSKGLDTEEITEDQEDKKTDEEQSTYEDVLTKDEEKIITLDKLINAGRDNYFL